MGKTWKKKKQRGRKGKSHHQRIKAAVAGRAKLQRALRQELEIVSEQFNQPTAREA